MELLNREAINMKLGELYLLCGDLHTALAKERGGGTPLTREEYLALNNRVREAGVVQLVAEYKASHGD